jgi:hypothetical protein
MRAAWSVHAYSPLSSSTVDSWNVCVAKDVGPCSFVANQLVHFTIEKSSDGLMYDKCGVNQ